MVYRQCDTLTIYNSNADDDDYNDDVDIYTSYI